MLANGGAVPKTDFEKLFGQQLVGRHVGFVVALTMDTNNAETICNKEKYKTQIQLILCTHYIISTSPALLVPLTFPCSYPLTRVSQKSSLEACGASRRRPGWRWRGPGTARACAPAGTG